MTASVVTGARFRVLSSSVTKSSVTKTGPLRPGSSLELFQPPWPALSLLFPHSPLSFFSLMSLSSHTVHPRHSLPPPVINVSILAALWSSSAASQHSWYCNLCLSPPLLVSLTFPITPSPCLPKDEDQKQARTEHSREVLYKT